MDIFSIIPVEVACDDRLTKTDLRVLIAVLSCRNKATNLYCPQHESIAKLTGLPINKISASITRLIELDWLDKRHEY